MSEDMILDKIYVYAAPGGITASANREFAQSFKPVWDSLVTQFGDAVKSSTQEQIRRSLAFELPDVSEPVTAVADYPTVFIASFTDPRAADRFYGQLFATIQTDKNINRHIPQIHTKRVYRHEIRTLAHS